MAPFKVPGNDGFQAGFYQRTWETTGNSIYRFVMDFFESGRLPEANDTLIALIPKVKHPDVISQFRSISLCNVGYKCKI